MRGSTQRFVVAGAFVAFGLAPTWDALGVERARPSAPTAPGRDQVRDASAAGAQKVIVIPRDYKGSYPFSLRYADSSAAQHWIDLAAVRFVTDKLVVVDGSGRKSFREPDLSSFPQALVRSPFSLGKTDDFIVQAKDPAAQVALLKTLEKGGVRILGYIPDCAYLVRLNEEMYARLASDTSVFWMGVHQPAYRTAPDLDYVIEQDEAHQLRIRARLDPETYPTEAAVEAVLKSLPNAEILDVTRGRRDWIVRFSGSASLAHVLVVKPGVMWAERFVEPTLHNNVARTSTSTATGRGAANGPIMDVEDVWARGIRGEGQIASAADTGLSTGNLATLHQDYGQQGNASNPMRVLKGYALGRSTWDDDQTTGGGHGTHTSGSIVGNGFRSGSDPATNTFPSTAFAGTAPKAQFVFQSIMDPDGNLGGIPADLNDLFLPPYNDGARVHSNSWGAPVAGEYNTDSESLDEFAWNHKDMVITFSAGNSGTDASSNDGVINADSIGAPGTAKNCITVGASENYRPDFVYEVPEGDCTGTSFTQTAWGWFNDTTFPAAPIYADLMANNASGMGAFSSRGPTDDTRFKPEITAPGIAIISTRTDLNQDYEQWGICQVPVAQRPYYVNMGGTSMSNPLTAGAATLVRQYFAEGWHPNNSAVTNAAPVPAQGFNPSSALVKATLVNGAWDMAPGQYGGSAPQPEIPPSWDRGVPRDLPNNAEGYGRVDLEASLFPGSGWGRDPTRSAMVRDVSTGLTTGVRHSYEYQVGSSADPLIVTLAWTDPYGLAAASTKLVNNLDLEVTSPSGRRYTTNRVDTYVMSPSAFVRDTLNNLEQVKVTSPEIGAWTIDVVGTGVPGNGTSGTTSQPYALVASAVSCVPLAAPSGVSATANGNNRIDVTWTAVASAAQYRVYRGTTAGGAKNLVGSVTAPTTTWADTGVQAGATYYYAVTSVSSGATPCESPISSEAFATATGVCQLPPVFAGLVSVANPATTPCGLQLAWSAATSSCGGQVSYSVYRSTTPGFTPGVANRIATGLSGTAFYDSGSLASGTTYYYLVRATDAGNGVEDENTAERSGVPTGTLATQSLYGPQTFDSLAVGDMAGWITGTFTGSAADWIGVRACTAHSGTQVFRYGGSANCTSNYANSRHSLARPPAIVVPAASTNVYLSFWHRWRFESGWDGGYLRISTDGTTYAVVPAAPVLAGGYTGTLDYGVSAWTGAQSTFVNTIVDLDAACDIAAGTTGGCAGKTIYVGFTVYADTTQNDDGWFIDDVHVYGDVAGSCSPAPEPAQYFTARSTSGTNVLEWQNPANGVYGSAVVRYRTDGTYPTSETDGTAVTCAVQNTALSAYNSCTHTGLANGTTYSYALFVADGLGTASSRRTVAATPFDTSGARKWSFSTGAANLAPAGIRPGALGTGAVYEVSNDRVLHAMNTTAAGGTWPRTAPNYSWLPLSMNAPAQHRPGIAPLAAGSRAFLASQDGYAYAVDAATGAQVWMSPKLGDVLQANPAGLFSDFKAGAPNLVFVGTRNATSANKLYGLDPATGAVVGTPFDNGGGSSAIGIITGITVDYATNYVYFTSRAAGVGSSHTLWCLNATGGTLAKVWSLAVGDVDGSPVLYEGRIYVGTNAGQVRAVDATTHLVVWTYPAAPGSDGPVKGYVTPDYGATPLRLYYSTNETVWGLTLKLDGSGVDSFWSNAVPSNPSTPLLLFGTAHLLVGCGDGTLQQLDTATGAVVKSVSVGTAALGSPAMDSVNGLAHVGSTAGVLHTVTAPIP